MDLDELWRSSRVVYTELVYRPIARSGYTPVDLDPRRSVKRALTGASLNKAIFAVFTMVGALFPFGLYELRVETKVDINLEVAVSLSILLVFGYIVLYCVQILPSFVTSGSFAPLTLLPLASWDVSRVAAMTLWRTLDIILLASLVSQLMAIAYLTHSLAATLLVTFASVCSSVLAVGLALWLTLVFQRRLEAGSLVGMRALFRPLYFIAWGLGVMSAVFIFNLISYLSPRLVHALSAPSSPVGFALSLIPPFSAGIVSAHFQGLPVSGLSLALGFAGLIIAAVGTYGAASVILRVISGVVLPSREVGGVVKSHLSFRVRRPVSAYVLKDLRVSSRNPATAFLYAVPFFEIFAVVIPLTSTAVVRVSVLLVGAQVGGGFALFIAFLLVTVEDLGIEKRTALPISEFVRTLSKCLVSTASYLPLLVVLAAILLTKTLTFGQAAELPALTTLSIFAGCVVEVSVLRWLSGGLHGAAVRFAAGVGSGEVMLTLPAMAYASQYSISHDHVASLVSFAFSTCVELAIAAVLLNASRRTSARSLPNSLDGS